MFESTRPIGEPDLMRVSAFRRYLDEVTRDNGGDRTSTRLSSLSPSLLQDLLRFERDGGRSDILEVMAACLRHARSLVIHVELDDRAVPLTVFPVEKLLHCPMPIERLLALRLSALEVMRVEPAVLRPPGDPETSLVGDPDLHAPLRPLLWELALRGPRDELLPEIAGQAAYRIAPDTDLRPLQLTGSLAGAIYRLARQTCNLREIAQWPGFDRQRAIRLLNALYLQAGLMVSRTHPAATNEGWFGSRF